MDAWVERALAKWPNVPALYGWLRLTRRGRWLIRDELISNPRIIRVINRNYDVDEHGRWFFQNGPQRGYIALDYAPYILQSQADGGLKTHNGLDVKSTTAAFLDEEGSFVLATGLGAGLIDDHDLSWVVERLYSGEAPVSEDELANALARPNGVPSGLQLRVFGTHVAVTRCNASVIPAELGFVRNPEPLQAQD